MGGLGKAQDGGGKQATKQHGNPFGNNGFAQSSGGAARRKQALRPKAPS